jgi:nitrogen regulatory protein P-II 1
MNKLEIIIKRDKLDDFKKILTDFTVNGLMISNIKSYDHKKGYKKICRGIEYNVNLLPTVKIETVVAPEVAEIIIDKVLKEISTRNYEDEKIFISGVDDVVCIRADERGNYSLQNII